MVKGVMLVSSSHSVGFTIVPDSTFYSVSSFIFELFSKINQSVHIDSACSGKYFFALFHTLYLEFLLYLYWKL